MSIRNDGRIQMPRSLTLFALLLLPFLAAAGDTPTYNRIHLDASASADVDNDRMIAAMFAQAENDEAAVAAVEVNRAITWALELVETYPTVQVQTTAYYTSPIYRNNAVRAWRVNQAIRLTSTDSSVLGELIGRLQERLQMQSVSYEVSDESRRSYIDQLTDNALGHFTERAARITATLGRDSYRLVQLSIQDNRHSPVPIARGLAMAAEAVSSAPARLEAGTQTVTVTVSGEIELRD
jgi:predicted secreted protein